MTAVIAAENLGKRYTLGHRARSQPYLNLRDTLAESAKAAGRRLVYPFTRAFSKSRDPRPRAASSEEFWALRDVSFDVQRGERVGVIGRNGAGKSTLLKILSRITEPSTGRVAIRGRVASLLEVGTGFHQELTGRENIYLNGAILGMKRAEIRGKFDEIVDFAEVERFLDTPVKRYSSGMYVRLAFAVAAHLEPEVLLIDEVLAVGDYEFQKKCLGKMEDISRGGRTLLFVSHNMLAIRSLCSRAVVLKQGRIEFSGDVSTAVETYTSDKSDIAGEVSWEDVETAPGNHQVRLKAVRVLSEGAVTGRPPIDKEIEVQVDYWNLEKDSRRLVSIHVLNSMNFVILTSANFNCCSTVPDPWLTKKHPIGSFRTSCTIPASLLNNGVHSVDLYINVTGAGDNIIVKRRVVSFDILEPEESRAEYLGEWVGAVRPKLSWQTRQLE